MQIQLNHDIVVLYHKNCLDGLGAAWVAWKAFDKKVDLVAVQYGNKFEEMFGESFAELIGKTVYCLDFSFDRETVKYLAGLCTLILLDHHNTAAEALKGIAATDIRGFPEAWETRLEPEESIIIVDERYSGAMLAWMWFFEEVPPFGIRCVQDRDLWAWKIKNSREWTSVAFSHEKTVENFDMLINTDPFTVIAEGTGLMRVQKNNVATVSKGARRFVLDGIDVPIVNCNSFLVSDVGDLLGQDEHFVATYIDTPHGRQFSLRSRHKDQEVNKLAERFGGGGHPQAAGFQIGFDDDRFGMSHIYLESEYYQRFTSELCKV